MTNQCSRNCLSANYSSVINGFLKSQTTKTTTTKKNIFEKNSKKRLNLQFQGKKLKIIVLANSRSVGIDVQFVNVTPSDSICFYLQKKWPLSCCQQLKDKFFFFFRMINLYFVREKFVYSSDIHISNEKTFYIKLESLKKW